MSVILLAGFSAAGDSAAQPVSEGPLLPALCRPSNAKLEILSPTGWTIKLPPGQAAATIQYRVKVSPGVTDPRCAEHYPNWQPAGWTVKTVFGRAQKSEFEANDIADFTWQAGGTATLGPGQWTMLSQVLLPELGASKTLTFTIEQEQVEAPATVAKTDRPGPRRTARPEAEAAPEPAGDPSGKGDTEAPSEGKDSQPSGDPSQVLSDLLSKIPGPKDKAGDATDAAGPTGDPSTTDTPSADPKDPKGPTPAVTKLNPKLAKALGTKGPTAGTKLDPSLTKKVAKVVVTPNPKTKTQPVTRVKVEARSRLECHTRRVGSHVQRICVRKR